MSDDLVKRYSSYNIMMLGDSGNEVTTPDGEWVKYKDYKAQADRIEELEAKLAKAVEVLIVYESNLFSFATATDDTADEAEIFLDRDRGRLARNVLAELTGETYETNKSEQ